MQNAKDGERKESAVSLDEWMAAATPGRDYYIGAKSSFIFVGTPEEWNKDADAIDRYWRTRNRRAVWAAKKRLQSAKGKVTEDVNEWRNNKEELEAVGKAYVMLCSLKAIQSNYTDFRTRRVKETYDRIGGGTVVLVEGTENGAYWTRDEYVKVKEGIAE